MTEDLNYVQRLREEQEKVLEENKQSTIHWQKLRENYSAVDNVLATLPDKISHDVMVPVGSVAFIPGNLVHTNEIMVLLGDNFFVSCSAKQAREIVGRRITNVDHHLENLEKEHNLVSRDLDFARHFEDSSKACNEFCEIKEAVPDGILEKKGNSRWVAREQKHDKIPITFKFEAKEEKSQRRGCSSQPSEDDELFAKLDKLELEEKGVIDDLEIPVDRVTKCVKFEADTAHREVTSCLQELDSDDTDTEQESKDVEKIVFSHSKICPQVLPNGDSNGLDYHSGEELNPGDILAKFGFGEDKPLKSILKKYRKSSSEATKPKPILKNSPEHKTGVVTGDVPSTVDDRKSILKGTNEACSGVVIEHTAVQEKGTLSKTTASKPVSKFKSSRKVDK